MWKASTEICLHPQIKHGFQTTNYHKTHNEATHFSGHIMHQILSKSDKNIESIGKFNLGP
jgi:hypothetical protein